MSLALGQAAADECAAHGAIWLDIVGCAECAGVDANRIAADGKRKWLAAQRCADGYGADCPCLTGGAPPVHCGLCGGDYNEHGRCHCQAPTAIAWTPMAEALQTELAKRAGLARQAWAAAMDAYATPYCPCWPAGGDYCARCKSGDVGAMSELEFALYSAQGVYDAVINGRTAEVMA